MSLGHRHLQDWPCPPSTRLERCAASHAPLFRPPQPHELLPRWRESVSGALGLLLFGARSWRGWVSLQERFEHGFPALTGAFHSEPVT